MRDMETTKTNWRKEFAAAGVRSNADTARELVAMEVAQPGYLSANEREFVTQVLGRDAFKQEASQ